MAQRLGDAAIDPAIWPQIMEELSAAAGARGAVLLQSDVRTPDIPITTGIRDYVRGSYFAEGWHMRDIRAERAVPRLLKGEKVVTDLDILSAAEMERAGLYAESLVPNGLKWFAVIGFQAGAALWGLSIQRMAREGPFDRTDKQVLAQLAPRLTETATLSAAVGRAVLSGATHALERVDRPALALDRWGRVLEANAPAERLFDDEIRIVHRRLTVRDPLAKTELARLIEQLRVTRDDAALGAEPIVVRRATRRPVVIGMLPVPGAACTPFLGARVLLTLTDLDRRSTPPTRVLAQAFGLTASEAVVASRIVAGLSIVEVADELGIALETARKRLKAVFAKTETHRQAELVALLARL